MRPRYCFFFFRLGMASLAPPTFALTTRPGPVVIEAIAHPFGPLTQK